MIEVRCARCGAVNRIPDARIGAPARCGKCHGALTTALGTITVTDQNFDSVVLQSVAPVLIDCWADWCGPCRMLAPTIDALARDYAGRVNVGKLDVDTNPQIAARFDVRSIPTLLLFRDGRLLDRITGLQARATIESRLRPLLAA